MAGGASARRRRDSGGGAAKANRHLELRSWMGRREIRVSERRASSTTMLHLQYAFPHSRSRGTETQHQQTGTRAPRRAPGRDGPSAYSRRSKLQRTRAPPHAAPNRQRLHSTRDVDSTPVLRSPDTAHLHGRAAGGAQSGLRVASLTDRDPAPCLESASHRSPVNKIGLGQSF